VRLVVCDASRLAVRTADGGLADVSDLVGDAVPADARLRALIERWAELRGAVAERAAGPGDPALANATLRSPMRGSAGKVIGAAANYLDHQAEMGGPDGVYKDETIATVATYVGFLKATTSIVGPDAAIVLPPDLGERRVDHEAELAVVIGRRAHRVAAADALDHVFGYVPLLDITVRGPEDRSYRKSFDTFTPIGPEVVTADEIPDPGDLPIELTVNGDVRQQASTRDLIWDVPRLIEAYSAAMTLEPGDVIATGTPAGVGPIEAGDVVRVTIGGVGTLEMPVR
jgi:2-keto-4-pentenoate hydratase/2-oxohepta-3-ene-1,7-dioic acid hydratase in catechol pathway